MNGEFIDALQQLQKEKDIPIDLALAFHTDAGVTPSDSTVGTCTSMPWASDSFRRSYIARSRSALCAMSCATSICPSSRPPRTVTTPNAAPILNVRRRPKQLRTSSGVALVATS